MGLKELIHKNIEIVKYEFESQRDGIADLISRTHSPESEEIPDLSMSAVPFIVVGTGLGIIAGYAEGAYRIAKKGAEKIDDFYTS